MAIKVVKNSKMRNVSICGAAETLLIDKMCLKTHCEPILNQLNKQGCKIIGDKIIKKFVFDSRFKNCNRQKIGKQNIFRSTISVKVVNGVEECYRTYKQIRFFKSHRFNSYKK